MNLFLFKNILSTVRSFKIKRILILNCILLLTSINFCKDNTRSEDSKKIQALSLLAVQTQNAKNQSQESTTCDSGQISISSNISAAVAKYIDCSNDSDCEAYKGGIPNWGEKCAGTCFGSCVGPAINSKFQDVLAKDLIALNETYCIGKVSKNCGTSICVASCIHPDYIKFKCTNKKCTMETLPF